MRHRRDFLALHGAALIDMGYHIVPLRPGEKRPSLEGWTKVRSSKDQLRDWLEGGFKQAGVGILTKNTCAVDIDCADKEVSERMRAWCFEHIGPTIVRVGRAPRSLLVYQAETPFAKQRTTKYQDEWADTQQIEFLGDGQQFVAFHIHPDTGNPYAWIDDKSPLTVKPAALPVLTQAHIDELKALFEEHAKGEDWKVVKAGRKGVEGGPRSTIADNPFIEDSSPITISEDELRARLMLVPVDGPGYDQWLQVGMALFHQFDGEDIGLELWKEWSEASEQYDEAEIDSKWKDFDIGGKGRAPITARFILRLSKEAVDNTTRQLSIDLRDAFQNAKDLTEWEAARKKAREAEVDGLTRSALATVAKDRRDAITGTKTPLTEIKKAIAYTPPKGDKVPGWAEGWVYDVSDDKFFSVDRQIAVTMQGFNAMYGRQALTKKDVLDGRSTPSATASDLALNVYRIRTVDGRRYMPGRDPIFHEPDGVFANTYPEREIPPKPEKEIPQDKRNVERVKAHVAHLLPKLREQKMLLDWLSWVVQNPGKHANYGVLLQGVQGDGKTFFAELMRAVMGVSNVTMANADIIHQPFTDWVEGQCLVCLEEVRIVGSKGRDKYEAINKIKPYITNHVIEVHPKGKKPFNCVNTTNYMLFSNYKDALPLDDNSRRYLVLFSQWQHKKDIAQFKADHPKYYERLYATLVESPGALRQWLLNHEQDEDFKPFGDAPDTESLKVMVRNSKPEFIQVLDEIISEDETLAASEELVNITDLNDALMIRGIEVPSPKALSSMMDRDNYEFLGRIRIGEERFRFYSKNPDQFQSLINGMPSTDKSKIEKYIEQRRAYLGSNDDDDDDEI